MLSDTGSNRKMLAMVLGKRDIACSMAVDGAEALQMVQAQSEEQHFDMIFMDNTMPVMVCEGFLLPPHEYIQTHSRYTQSTVSGSVSNITLPLGDFCE